MQQSGMPARLIADHVEISTSRPRTVLDLPPEIIVYIAELLPKTSTALFALCNKTSASQLRSRSWNLLSSLHAEDRIDFLSILSRDLPRYQACHGCVRLQVSSSIPHPAEVTTPSQHDSCISASDRRDSLTNGVACISDYFSSYRIRFSHVKLALKRHHYGLDHGISLDELSHTEVEEVRSSSRSMPESDPRSCSCSLRNGPLEPTPARRVHRQGTDVQRLHAYEGL
jgi:hypothetical protein